MRELFVLNTIQRFDLVGISNKVEEWTKKNGGFPSFIVMSGNTLKVLTIDKSSYTCDERGQTIWLKLKEDSLEDCYGSYYDSFLFTAHDEEIKKYNEYVKIPIAICDSVGFGIVEIV